MNIFVGNLSYNLEEEDLENAFREYGEVSSVKIITDKFTGRSRGFGFIEMPNDAEGQSAIDGLEGSDLKGRTLRVSKAKPPQHDRD